MKKTTETVIRLGLIGGGHRGIHMADWMTRNATQPVVRTA